MYQRVREKEWEFCISINPATNSRWQPATLGWPTYFNTALSLLYPGKHHYIIGWPLTNAALHGAAFVR